jgi:hypothetical protein
MASIHNDQTSRNVHRFAPLSNSGGSQGFFNTVGLGVSLSPNDAISNGETLIAFLNTYLSTLSTFTTGISPGDVTYLNPFQTNALDSVSKVPATSSTSPLVVSPSSDFTWTLPNAADYKIGLGGPQVGGIYVVPVINLGTANATFKPGDGGSGLDKIVPKSENTPSYLFIKFTSNNTYTLQ